MRITVKQCAEIIGGSEMFVREKCKDGTLGTVYGTGKQRKSFFVIPGKLAAFMGWTEERLEDELGNEESRINGSSDQGKHSTDSDG